MKAVQCSGGRVRKEFPQEPKKAVFNLQFFVQEKLQVGVIYHQTRACS